MIKTIPYIRTIHARKIKVIKNSRSQKISCKWNIDKSRAVTLVLARLYLNVDLKTLKLFPRKTDPTYDI